MQQPGVGPIVSLAFVLTLGTAKRFPRGKQVASYLGLNPAEHSSGGKQRLGHISKQGNRMMRWLLVEAAYVAVRKDPELKRIYQRLAFRRGRKIAAVAVGRKLAVKLYWRVGGRKKKTKPPPAPQAGGPRPRVGEKKNFPRVLFVGPPPPPPPGGAEQMNDPPTPTK